MATSEFPENGERRYNPDRPSSREAWTPTFDGPQASNRLPSLKKLPSINNNNNARSPSDGSRRDPRVHPVDDEGKLVDQEKGERRRKKDKVAHGNEVCCVCAIVIVVLVIIAAVVAVVVLLLLTGFQFGSSAPVTQAPATFTATTTTTTSPTLMTTDDDVTAEMVTYDMTTTDSMASQNGETNTYATTDEPTSTAMDSTTA